MKNIFLILFIIAAIVYGYSSIQGYELLKSIGIFSLIPFLLIHYLVNTKRITFLYILALIFTFFGDTSFHIKTDGIARELLTIISYIFFNLFIALIILERQGFKNLKKIISLSVILSIILLFINYLIFKNAQLIIFSTAVYFISLAIICASSISFYLKFKSKEALYYLIGVVSFFFASITKGLEYLDTTSISIILNTLFYVISNYFYVNAVLMFNNNNKN